MLLHLRRKYDLQIFAPYAFGVFFLLAIALRVSLYHVITSDYSFFLSQWYDQIKNNGGFAALKNNFSNYNPPYLYLIAIATYTPIPKLIAIKTISVIFDVVLAFFTYLLIRLRYQEVYAALAGALVILFAPTIFINSASWGQCDAIYTAFCLGSLYFLLKNRPGWACVFFGLAFAFKLQAIFFLPVLLVLLLRRKLPLKFLVLIPLVFLLMLAPAFIAGRDATSLLSVYVNQASTGGVGGGAGNFGGFRNGQSNNSAQPTNPGAGQFNGNESGQNNNSGNGQPNNFGQPNGNRSSTFTNNGFNNGNSTSLTLNAPTIYQWFPSNAPAYWKWFGIILAGLFVAFIGFLVWRSKQAITSDIVLKLALVFAVAIPFLLPEMHERYFYLADVLSILYAFYFPRYFYIAVIVQLCSLLSYAPYFYNSAIIDLSVVALTVLVVAFLTTADLVHTLYPATPASPAVEPSLSVEGPSTPLANVAQQQGEGRRSSELFH